MYHISFYVPILDAEKVKLAMFAAGAGEHENYTQCSWQTEGKGQFIPINNAKPTIGEIGQTETIPGVKVEMICHKDKINDVVTSMKNTHPYETVAYTVVRMEEK